MRLQQRLSFLFIFLSCAALLSYALWLQQAQGLLPCPLCVVQRIAYCLVGLTAWVALVHQPGMRGRRIYSVLIACFALAGAVVAARHAWLLRFPNSMECGVSPEQNFLNALPLARWWPSMFEALGDCALIKWRFLTLAIPDWSLLWFIIFIGMASYLFFAKDASLLKRKGRA